MYGPHKHPQSIRQCFWAVRRAGGSPQVTPPIKQNGGGGGGDEMIDRKKKLKLGTNNHKPQSTMNQYFVHQYCCVVRWGEQINKTTNAYTPGINIKHKSNAAVF